MSLLILFAGAGTGVTVISGGAAPTPFAAHSTPAVTVTPNQPPGGQAAAPTPTASASHPTPSR